MRIEPWKLVIVAVAIAAGVGGLAWQRRIAAELRGEIAARTTETAGLARVRREHMRLAAEQVSRDELEKLRADHAAIDRLRTEIETLKVKKPEAVATAMPMAETATEQDAAPPKAESLMTPASAWKNAGRATPQAALETALWAATGGDVEALALMLAMDVGARAKAQAIMAQLPPAAQAEYSTPERLVALLSAKDVPTGGMRILQQKKNGTDDVSLTVLLESDGKRKGVNLALHRSEDGWRLVVPESAMDKYAAALSGTAKAEGAK